MPHPPSPPLRAPGRDQEPTAVVRPAAWGGQPCDAGAAVAVLITGCRDAAAAVRGYKTVLPRARVLIYGDELSADERAAAAAAGAEVRAVPAGPRDALVRRMFAEVEADTYILAHGATADDVCVAPLVVAEVDGGADLVDVRRVAGPGPDGLAERLLRRTVDFAFGGWGDTLCSDFKACSRRFALSYRRTAPRGGRDASARDLALHALRLRLPVGRVAALAAPREAAAESPDRAAAGWLAPAGIVARLLVEERPRRVFGLAGLALVGSGLAVSAPDLKVYHWHATLLPGAQTLATTALLAAGAVAGAAGLLLDSLASARQEVRRLGAAAIPRRAERPRAVPEVGEPRARRATSA